MRGWCAFPGVGAGKQAERRGAAYPAVRTARDLRAAVGSDQPSQPAAETSRQAQLDQRAKALRKRDLTGE